MIANGNEATARVIQAFDRLASSFGAPNMAPVPCSTRFALPSRRLIDAK